MRARQDSGSSTPVASELVLDGPTERLCTAVGDGRHAPARLAVLAPGQYGKSALLEWIAACRGQAGLPVCRFGSGYDAAHASDTLLLVDDAHLLTSAEIEVLRAWLDHEHTGLVLAGRGRPRSDEFNKLLAELRGQIVLRPFDVARTERCLRWFSTSPSSELVRIVHQQSDGVPGFVTELARAWCTAGGGRDAGEVQPGSMPVPVLSTMRRELDQASAEVLHFVLAAEAGAGDRVELLATLLRGTPDEVGEVVEAAHAIGVLGSDGCLIPLAAEALRSVVPAQQRQVVRQRIAELAVSRGQSLLPMVRSWLDNSTTGAAVAVAYDVAAREALPTDPGLAARLLTASIDAGREFDLVGVRWAEATALSGNLDSALRLADRLITRGAGTNRTDGAFVAGVVLAHRGQTVRSAELLEWAARSEPGGRNAAAFASVALIVAGRATEAGNLLHTGRNVTDPPSLLSCATRSMATGLLTSVTGGALSALSELANAAETLEPVADDALLMDSPAALAAIVAVHCGEPETASSVLDRAIDVRAGGTTLLPRHLLLRAWLAMMRGDLTVASADLARVRSTLTPRDRLFAVALEVGIARRASDVSALRRAWRQARELVIRYPVDLLTLLPLGELAVAGARIGEFDRMDRHLRMAVELLSALGDPPLWAGLFHWHCLHAAIIADAHERAAEHVETLCGYAERLPHCAVLATAAQCWQRALSGRVEPGEVEAAARGLAEAGMDWDGARLAGQAAIHTTNRADMRTLLDCARLLQGSADGRTEPEEHGDRAVVANGAGPLSEREREVGGLVLSGMTYKEVGARLYISAKTVEHHMARMRQRLGASSRADLFHELRAQLGE